jgi:hypothetical protein
VVDLAFGMESGVSRIPLLIHTMGKCGSKSIELACARLERYEPIHTHYFGPGLDAIIARWEKDFGGVTRHMRSALRVRRDILEPGVPFRMITATRDPLARNVSAFFENLKAYGFRPDEMHRAQEMTRVFQERYPHDRPARWFDEEVRNVLGLDVFAEPFDPGAGHRAYRVGGSAVLVLQVELPDERKAEALRAFLDEPAIEVVPANEGGARDYSEAYRRFRDLASFDAPFVEAMYSSTYARHFYSAGQIASFRARWVVRGGAAAQGAAP